MNKNSIDILLVDDNQDDVFLTKQALQKYDKRFQIEPVSNGEECLNKLDTRQYSVLLLDYSLPGMDGLGVLKTIVKSGYDIPIIIVTGQGNEEVAVKSMKKGAYDYIIKSEDYLKILPVVIQKVIEKCALDKMKVKLEEDTLDKKNKLEATLNSTSDGILMVSYTSDNAGFISIINKRFKEIFRLKDDIFHNQENGFDLITNWCAEDWVCSSGTQKGFLELYKDRKVEKREVVENVEKGQVIELYTGPVYDGNKNIIGRIWSFRDVTERVELEKRLKRISITDYLTKLFNQGYFYEMLEKEIERAKRQTQKLSLTLFDIDNFKEYNDTYGHQKGDRVIETIGEIVLSAIREKVDSAFRYGGDEFTIILPETSIEQAMAVAERIRQSFEETGFATLSIGLIEMKQHYTADELVRNADKAMYLAKNAGGNRIHVYT